MTAKGADDRLYTERHFLDVLRANPRNFEALFGLGMLSGRRGQYDEAARLMGLAAAADPSSSGAHFMRGSALLQAMRFEEAVASFGAALALRPSFAECLLNRAAALFRLKRHAEAEKDYDTLLRLDPSYPYARGNRLFCRMHLCDWRAQEEESASIAALAGQGQKAVAPFDAKAFFMRAEDEYRCASIWAKDQVSPPAEVSLNPFGHKKIRIAYVADTFGDDPVSMLLAGVIEHHDRERFETIGVAFDGFRGTALGTRIAKAFGMCVTPGAGDDAQIAARLRAMEIDIAVDLKGYTEGCRPGVFAARVAPVQVNYLGFPGTMGASFMDYILADRIAIPHEDRRHYRESVVYLPGTFLPCDSKRAAASRVPSRKEAGLPESGFVFASFNNAYKFHPRVFAVWMRLLNAVTGSVLWLPGSNPAAVENLSREAEERGVGRDRLVFAPFVPDSGEHLARLSLADLFLDTLPYNAHSTAMDALQAGLPVLTAAGETFAGRVAASLLHAAGLEELVTQSLRGYEDMALRLACDGAFLARVKSKLAANKVSCAAFDTLRYTRHLEAAYAVMHERSGRALPPESFSVTERI
jgi:protein O-GlcNAc transferase